MCRIRFYGSSLTNTERMFNSQFWASLQICGGELNRKRLSGLLWCVWGLGHIADEDFFERRGSRFDGDDAVGEA